MYKLHIYLLLLCLGYGSCTSGALIIPEELPSLLSVAYSNIPPIKKGTDSRVGFGFAFGNHADFQVMFELGPQTNTNPIGQPYPTNSKRQAPSDGKVNNNREKFRQSESGSYLMDWADRMNDAAQPSKRLNRPQELPSLEDSLVELVQNPKGHYEIHQPSPVGSAALAQLKKLYGEDGSKSKKFSELINGKAKINTVKPGKDDNRTAEDVKKITDDLSNVDLD